MYKVFFKENCFLLTDNQNLLKEGTVTLVHRNFNATKNFITGLLRQEEKFKAVIYHDDLEDLFGIFKSCFLYVKAAGGAVRQEGCVLMIKRAGMYDLPKGHVEACETIEACAVREVEEECGIQQVSITGALATTLHIYPRNEDWFLKKTYWYNMICPDGQTPTPQTEEDIDEVFWFPVDRLESVFSQTYPSLIEVMKKIKSGE